MHRPTEGEIMHSAGATAILSQLTRRQREAVLLLADGYTHEEAGTELGVSRTAVTMRLKRAGERVQKRDIQPRFWVVSGEAQW